ncbi:MAG: lasso peptide biosynthesis B2 protein [Chloroflexi bacterium]|nr:lasso peptide biosynthesis B2 protein [Chloroflexota bacterium]MBU1879958.1 lasso peptide biosynthesis B2 protein [Chloroflexota bacterium]
MKGRSRLLRQHLAKLCSHTWIERGLLLEALFWLVAARLVVLLIPFRYIAPLLGSHMAMSPTALLPEQAARSRQVGWAVRAVARRTPWDSNCLAQAIAGKMMLRRRGIASTLYLGVAKDEDKDLAAHAWLRSGDQILTGGSAQERFTVLSTFAERPKGSGATET